MVLIGRITDRFDVRRSCAESANQWNCSRIPSIGSIYHYQMVEISIRTKFIWITYKCFSITKHVRLVKEIVRFQHWPLCVVALRYIHRVVWGKEIIWWSSFNTHSYVLLLYVWSYDICKQNAERKNPISHIQRRIVQTVSFAVHFISLIRCVVSVEVASAE